MRKAILKVVFVLMLANKSIADKLLKYSAICNGLDAQVASLPTPTPTTASTRLIIAEVNSNITDRQNLWDAADAKTVLINNGMETLNGIFVNDYMGYVQSTVAGNKDVGIAVGYGVKKPGTAAPDAIAPPTGVVCSQGKTPDSLKFHCDSFKGLGVKEVDIQVCLLPRAPIPVYVHWMYTGATSEDVTGLPLNTEVGVRAVFIGKKAGVESLPSAPFIRYTS